MENSSEKGQKWYYSTAVIILSLFLCFPIGLGLLWANSSEQGILASKKAKVIVSFLLVFLVALLALTDERKESVAVSTPSTETLTTDELKKEVTEQGPVLADEVDGPPLETVNWNCNRTSPYTMLCAGQVKNRTKSKSYKDVNVCCDFYGSSGTKIDVSCERFYKAWKPGEAKYLSFESMARDQISQFSCSVKPRLGSAFTEL